MAGELPQAEQWWKDQEGSFTAERGAAMAQRRSILETEWSTQNARRAAESEQCLKKLAAIEARLAKVPPSHSPFAAQLCLSAGC